MREETVSADLPLVTVSDFCEFFRRQDTFVRYHYEQHKNDHIRVGVWDEDTRRLAFLVPYGAPAWLKRTVGTEVVKIRDYQKLAVEEEGGAMTGFVMTSLPMLILPKNLGGEVNMGKVRFSVAQALINGVPGCKVVAHVTCTAEHLKWLWALRSTIEKIMMKECHTIAVSFIAYSVRIFAERREAGCSWSPEKPAGPPAPLTLGEAGGDEAWPALDSARGEPCLAAANLTRDSAALSEAGAASRMSSLTSQQFYDALEELSLAGNEDAAMGDEDAAAGNEEGPANTGRGRALAMEGPGKDGMADGAIRHTRFESLDDLPMMESPHKPPRLATMRSLSPIRRLSSPVKAQKQESTSPQSTKWRRWRLRGKHPARGSIKAQHMQPVMGRWSFACLGRPRVFEEALVETAIRDCSSQPSLCKP